MRRTIVLLCALLFAGSPGLSRTRVDFDHGTHFSSYKTYSWDDSADTTPGHDRLFPNQLMQGRVETFIEEAMAARGFKRVPSGGDLLISYHIKVTQEPVFTTFSDGWGPGWGWGNGWGSGFSTTTVQTFYSGTLIINMVDGRQKKLVFQGASTEDVSSRPERNTRRFGRAVNEIFEKYPPQK